jgi:hypothetical protein
MKNILLEDLKSGVYTYLVKNDKYIVIIERIQSKQVYYKFYQYPDWSRVNSGVSQIDRFLGKFFKANTVL